MIISIDTVPQKMQPDTLAWQPPTTLGFDSLGSAVRAPNWSCRLGFSRLTNVQYENWFSAWSDRALHTITLPHPSTGELTAYICYVTELSPRFDTRLRADS